MVHVAQRGAATQVADRICPENHGTYGARIFISSRQRLGRKETLHGHVRDCRQAAFSHQANTVFPVAAGVKIRRSVGEDEMRDVLLSIDREPLADRAAHR